MFLLMHVSFVIWVLQEMLFITYMLMLCLLFGRQTKIFYLLDANLFSESISFLKKLSCGSPMKLAINYIFVSLWRSIVEVQKAVLIYGIALYLQVI